MHLDPNLVAITIVLSVALGGGLALMRLKPPAVGGHILAVQDADHAGRCQSRRFVDAANLGVGVGRAHKVALGHVGQHDVVGVLSGAGEKAVVFLAADGLPNVGEFGEVGCTHVASP